MRRCKLNPKPLLNKTIGTKTSHGLSKVDKNINKLYLVLSLLKT